MFLSGDFVFCLIVFSFDVIVFQVFFFVYPCLSSFLFPFFFLSFLFLPFPSPFSILVLPFPPCLCRFGLLNSETLLVRFKSSLGMFCQVCTFPDWFGFLLLGAWFGILLRSIEPSFPWRLNNPIHVFECSSVVALVPVSSICLLSSP